jgi:hypothetical protein
MSTKKTIQINPELFKMPGSKTKKNREKTTISLKPIVSPSNLKNKLLKRIKEHKTKELNTNSNNTSSKDDNTYTDEFYGAIDYLSGLKQKQKQQTILNNKTLKNHMSTSNGLSNGLSNGPSNGPSNGLSNGSSNLQISLDFPPELAEPNRIPMDNNEVFNMNYQPNDNVPYGCLKNGKKKTYREWKEFSSSSINQELPDLVRPPTPPKKTNGIFFTSVKDETITNQKEANDAPLPLSREHRLEQIKNKLRKLEDQETASKRKSIEDFSNMEKEMNKPLQDINLQDINLQDINLQDINLQDIDNSNLNPNVEELIKQREERIESQIPKQYLKKTVKRKFTLGKSDKLRQISVLIKDRQTRKNIINTQKELKKTDITDVKKYLRQHGIIKVGSTCPTDILRKTFESAVLTGEITNTNKDILLHNFLNES